MRAGLPVGVCKADGRPGGRQVVGEIVGELLVGRGEELSRIADGLRRTTEPAGAALVLRGPAGVGKSALLTTAAGLAREQGLRVLSVTGVQAETRLPFAALRHLLDPLGGLGLETAEPHTAGLAALELLSAAGENGPICLIVDDAQWIDLQSWEALAFLGRRLPDEPLFLLVAVREGDEAAGRLAGLGLAEAQVGPLAEEDAESLLDRVAADLAPELRGRVLTEAGGNPLGLIELAATAGRHGGPGSLPLTARLERTYATVVDGLPAPTRKTLLVAAVDDSESLDEVLSAAGGEAKSLRPALTAGLLTVDGDVVRFRHPLIRSAVYRGAGAADRRRVHAALAAVCDPVLDLDRQAWHRAEATIGLDEQVAAHLERASENARSRGGYAEQAAFLARAAELSPDPQDQAARLVAAARAHLARALLDRAEPALVEPVPRALARQARATAQIYSGRFTQVPAILLEAAESIADQDAGLARKMMFEALQAIVFSDDRVTTVTLRDLAREVLASPAAQTPAPGYTDLFLTGFATRTAVGYRAAVPLMRAALQALDTADNLAEECLPLAVISAFTAEDVWDDEAGHRAWQRLEAHDRANGALGTLLTTLMVGATWEMRAGRFAAAYARHDELAQLSDVLRQAHPRIQLVELLAWSGREAEARAAATADVGFDDVINNSLAVLEIGLGRYAEALAALLPSFERDMPGVANRSLHDIVEAGVRGGNPEAAEAALARMQERVPVSGTAWGLGLLARCRALLADDEHAEQLYRESADQLARTRITIERARTHLLYGEWLRRGRRRADARTQLRTAHDMFTKMGAAAFAERARSELTAAGERPQDRAEQVTHGLTPQEKQVASLAAAGATNGEIAARLFLSTSTVEYHLTKIFRKLAITSRRKLAAALGDDG